MKKRFLSVFLALALCLTLLPTAAFADGGEDAHSHCVCGKMSCTDSSHVENVTFTAWTDELAAAQNGGDEKFTASNSLPKESGSYYLAGDVTITETWTPADGTVLCLNGKTITITSDVDGITVSANRTFTLTDCTDQGNMNRSRTTDKDDVNVSGTFRMYNGILKNDLGYYGGGGVGLNGGKFEMYGGKITGMTNGCAVQLLGGTFDLYGGTITGCAGGYTGGILVQLNGIVNMYGGSITDNQGGQSHNKSGGGVFVDRGAFNMYGGSITNNRSLLTEKCGAVLVYGGAFNMYGGTITDNNCGGVHVYYYDSDAAIKFANSDLATDPIKITGNTVNGSDCNVYLPNGKIINIGSSDLPSGSSIGITTETTPSSGSPVQVLSGQSDYNGVKSFFSADADSTNTWFVNAAGKLAVPCTTHTYEADGDACSVCGYQHSHCVCGGSCTTMDSQYHSCSDMVFKPHTSSTQLPASGNYYLTTDVTVTWERDLFGDLNLCLNGHTVTVNIPSDRTTDDTGIRVKAGCTFTLTDCSANHTGKLVRDSSSKPLTGIRIISDSKTSYGTFNMYGGTISGFNGFSGYQDKYYGGAIYSQGAFNMYGGTISGNTVTGDGGAVFDGNIFNMYGGTISDNRAENGGAVYIIGSTPFNMYGGIISGNTATSGGGGVYVGNGIAQLSGGTITQNNAVEGGGVFNYMNDNNSADKALHLCGTTISKNTATRGGGVYNGYYFYMSDGSITENTASEGGGIYHYAYSYLSGGSVTGNKATSKGGGLYAHTDRNNSVELSGSINISQNTEEIDGATSTSNVYLPYSDGDYSCNRYTVSFKVKADETTPFTGSVGVRTEKAPTAEEAVLISNGSAAQIGQFTPDNEDYIIRADGENLMLALKPRKIPSLTVEDIHVTYGDTITISGTAKDAETSASITGT